MVRQGLRLLKQGCIAGHQAPPVGEQFPKGRLLSGRCRHDGRGLPFRCAFQAGAGKDVSDQAQAFVIQVGFAEEAPKERGSFSVSQRMRCNTSMSGAAWP